VFQEDDKPVGNRCKPVQAGQVTLADPALLQEWIKFIEQ